jgi:phospholipid/cholesterol/gamma-HCH transport system substrate-binding protein
LRISKEIKTGAVVIAGIAFFIYGFNFLKGSNMFTRQKTIYAVYSNVEGLLESNNIELSGVKIGTIKRIGIMPKDMQGRIIVAMKIDDYVQIPSDSKARIISFDLLGSKAIRIEMGSSSNLAASGDTLQSEVEDDLKTAVDKRIAPLQKKAEELISSIDSVMVVVQQVLNKDARQNLVKSFESIKRGILNFEKTSQRLDTIVGTQQYKLSAIFSKMESIISNLASNNDNITRILSNTESITDSLKKSQIKSTIDHANIAFSDAALILDRINKGQGTIGMLINNDSLYRKLDKSSGELNALLKDFQDHPKRYVHFSVFGGKEKSRK